ncbi:unnamed protein product [Parnassius apollo]|uniref:(apollo) hypothetical protein n=1 Tax=Parnassius apollo TaxID=110799 RepID=A0A8S3X1V0_PARAO|nr:unnamed protein product [Parnassius apollo]
MCLEIVQQSLAAKQALIKIPNLAAVVVAYRNFNFLLIMSYCRKYNDYNAAPLFASENASSEVWSASGGAGVASACGSSGMDLKHEVAYRGVLPGQVKAEPGVSHNGHPANGHVREWMAGGAAGGGSPSPGAAVQPQPNNGYSSPLSSSSYGPYSPNGKIAGSRRDENKVAFSIFV